MTPIATAPASESAAADESVHPGIEVRSVQLVQCVRTDPDGEKEREQRCGQAVEAHDRRSGDADRDVGQVPHRVGRVQDRPPVAPAAAADRVERRRRLGVALPLNRHVFVL